MESDLTDGILSLHTAPPGGEEQLKGIFHFAGDSNICNFLETSGNIKRFISFFVSSDCVVGFGHICV